MDLNNILSSHKIVQFNLECTYIPWSIRSGIILELNTEWVSVAIFLSSMKRNSLDLSSSSLLNLFSSCSLSIRSRLSASSFSRFIASSRSRLLLSTYKWGTLLLKKSKPTDLWFNCLVDSLQPASFNSISFNWSIPLSSSVSPGHSRLTGNVKCP